MQRNRIQFILLFGASSLLFLCQGCDVRGARHPFSYAPSTSHSIWVPSEKALKRIPLKDRTQEMEDYTELSKDKPLSLAEVIDVSLYQNPDTKESWAAARVSAAEYGQSLKKDFVLAEIDGNYSRSRSAEFFLGQRQIVYETIYGAELQLSYTILDFGQTRASSEAALYSLYNADWSHNSTIQSTIQVIMNDYYDYLYQKRLLFSKEQDVINAQVSLEATQERFHQGLADVSDIVQAKTSYLQQKLSVVSQKRDLHSSYTKLLNDMGLDANAVVFFQDYPKTIETFDLDTLDNLINTAIENRPDFLAKEADVHSKEQSLLAAKRQKFPVVTSEFDIGRKYFQKGVNDTYDFQLLFSLTFPVFQGYYIENSIKAAEAKLESTKAELEQIKLELIQNVANYRSDVIFARESLGYAKSYLESAEEEYKVNLQKYKAGTTTIVDLISAQTSVSDARAKVAATQNAWYTSIANLAYATGILLPPDYSKRASYLQTIEKEESLYE
jgi:outer membrane protein